MLNVYYREILDFLHTTTIKFKPLADLDAKRLYTTYGMDDIPDEYNPYYYHLCGLYHDTDTIMEVLCVETGVMMDLTRDNLKKYPKTAAAYKIPSVEYNNLLKLYPEQKGLIKQIFYPAANTVEEAIALPDLALVGYDRSLLESNEVESIVNDLKLFLKYFQKRWYRTDFDYEDLYIPAVWALIWYMLPLQIMTTRIKNRKTNSAHSYHIWEYLKSQGLGNYSAILTKKQALFLYRNIEYIWSNKGKSSNLGILADNLLADLRVSMVGKTIRHQIEDVPWDCVKVPEVVSEDIKFQEYRTAENTIETLDELLGRLYYEGLDNKHDYDNTEAHTKLLQYLSQAETLTKYLELQQDTISTRYKALLYRFLLDTMMYRYSIGDLRYRVKFVDKASYLPIDLPVGDAIALFFYAVYQAGNRDMRVGKIPKYYHCRIPYKNVKPLKSDVVSKFHLFGDYHYTDTIIDIQRTLDQMRFVDRTFNSPTELSTECAEQFKVLMYHVWESTDGSDVRFQHALLQIYDTAVVRRQIEFDLTGYDTFQEWIEASPQLTALTNAYDDLTSPREYYDELATQLLEILVPTTHSYFLNFVGLSKNVHRLYKDLKNLFTQLCSYSVTFLDTSRLEYEYLIMEPLASCVYSSHNKCDLALWWDDDSYREASDRITVHADSADHEHYTCVFDSDNVVSPVRAIHEQAFGMTGDSTTIVQKTLTDPLSYRCDTIDQRSETTSLRSGIITLNVTTLQE